MSKRSANLAGPNRLFLLAVLSLSLSPSHAPAQTTLSNLAPNPDQPQLTPDAIEARRKTLSTETIASIAADRAALERAQNTTDRAQCNKLMQEDAAIVRALQITTTSYLGQVLADLDKRNQEIDAKNADMPTTNTNIAAISATPEKAAQYAINAVLADSSFPHVWGAANAKSATVVASNIVTREVFGVPRPVIPPQAIVDVDFTMESSESFSAGAPRVVFHKIGVITARQIDGKWQVLTLEFDGKRPLGVMKYSPVSPVAPLDHLTLRDTALIKPIAPANIAKVSTTAASNQQAKPPASTFVPTHRITMADGSVLQGILTQQGEQFILKMELGSISLKKADIKKIDLLPH